MEHTDMKLEDLICPWALRDPLSLEYHNLRWGKLPKEDSELFALLELEVFSSGLSWSLILSREKRIRECCLDMDPEALAEVSDSFLESLLRDSRMIRNRSKVYWLRENARAFLKIQKAEGSFKRYLDKILGEPVDHRPRPGEIPPSSNPDSERLAADMKRWGFKGVGPVVAYSFMQAVGYVNDHVITCPYRGNSRNNF